ncbi:MAG: class I SAM-dependent methyltransferase [Chloroflexi bacterium]|nr:class I SAM-dependent methyltransferase [Chloroflexota bacterium]
MTPDRDDLAANVERFTGFARVYNSYRPRPPAALLELLPRLARVERPRLAVDLGSGTGLSTRFWAGRAGSVIGVEPSDDMRREARRQTTDRNVSYRPGFSHATGLPGGRADLVTCSQSLHWMEPDSTFAEVARRVGVRPGGVFAAYDCDWPPILPAWQAEQAYQSFMERLQRLEKEHGLREDARRWHKGEHLARMEASGRFRYTREMLLHHVESGNAGRLVGLALSQGHVQAMLERGFSEAELGLDELRAAARRTLSEAPGSWLFCYRVRVGVV